MASDDPRRRFLGLIERDPKRPTHRLYVLDGGSAGDPLFRGLADGSLGTWYATTKTTYLQGTQGRAMANALGISDLPAIVLADADNTLLGVLAHPTEASEVLAFVRDPVAQGELPVPARPTARQDDPLRAGVPVTWLTAGVFGGRAGYSGYALDGEARLRPNPGEPFIRSVLLTDYLGHWTAKPTRPDGTCVIAGRLPDSFAWLRGTAYAHVYLHAGAKTHAVLRITGSAHRVAGWLDGKPLEFRKGSTKGERIAELDWASGWHRLLLKLITRQQQGARFAFTARITDRDGRPLSGVQTRLTDPEAELTLAHAAARLTPLFYLDVPGNLPWPGEPLRLRANIRWRAKQARGVPAWQHPIRPFPARLKVRLTDYYGQEVATKTVAGVFPGTVTVDLRRAPEAGFYALEPVLYALDGRLIRQYPADGFTVVRGTAAQRQRRDRKKLWTSYYDLFTGRPFSGKERAYQFVFPWMDRIGVLQNLGSHAGFRKPVWQAADAQGLLLTGDFRDPHQQYEPEDKALLAERIALYTRYFKGFNEIDIDPRGRPAAERWVELTRSDYQAAKRARSDAVYGGSSLARPGAPAVLDWFVEALRLGLDRYQDRWDIHVYPQQPPVLEGPMGNGEAEGERGVRKAYRRLNRENPLTFWLGETGALPEHGFDGLRWQAETTAKLVAWVNSRPDFELLAFCAAFAYPRELPLHWGYAMGHRPGEAALYTASALIDGLPYRRVATASRDIQAAYFGDTFMIWASERPTDWALRLDPAKRWRRVDVVGHSQPLAVSQEGEAIIAVTKSPIYVLPEEAYQRLTRFEP